MIQQQKQTEVQEAPRLRMGSPTFLRGVLVMLGAAALAFSGCKGRQPDTSLAPGWTPTSEDAVMQVDATAVVAAIEEQLASARPTAIPADRWKHVQRLYTTYGNVPLWLETDGFNQARSKALLGAVLDAETDALGLDAYPLTELVAAVSGVRESKRPTAEQLATADVLMTSAYVGLAEDLLAGQLNPKSLAQDWHIAANREPIDSAVARSLRETRLDSAIARMRPRDADYEALRRAFVRFRGIVSGGGWPTVPVGKALKSGQTDKSARIAALRER
ncbi:MAG: hypothetical protein ABIW79_04095, partial [Gemmatimonas sp.]